MISSASYLPDLELQHYVLIQSEQVLLLLLLILLQREEVVMIDRLLLDRSGVRGVATRHGGLGRSDGGP